jgi:TRAP-type C4-dicarboxylate transport system permease small subunit
MIWWGIEFTRFGWNQTSELADLPMWLIFIAWPVAGVSWLLFLIEGYLRDIDLDRRDEDIEANAPRRRCEQRA